MSSSSRSLSILLRSDRQCRLAASLLKEVTARHATDVKTSLSVLPSIPVTDFCVYVANGVGEDFPFALSGFVERGTLWRRFIAVHDRERHRHLQPPTPSQNTHLIHVFCDTALLQGGDISLYSAAAARRICSWVLSDASADDQQGSRLRSGAFINVTDLGSGRVASGVMSGGTKSPLGAML
jgi:hypothetical protein